MSAGLVEHRGVIRRIQDGRAVVAMDTGGCRSCGHGASCGIGKIAGDRPATLLSLQSSPGLKVGDIVAVTLSERRLNRSALFGYLMPAVGMLVGAWVGQALVGSDGASAVGPASACAVHCLWGASASSACRPVGRAPDDTGRRPALSILQCFPRSPAMTTTELADPIFETDFIRRWRARCVHSIPTAPMPAGRSRRSSTTRDDQERKAAGAARRRPPTKRPCRG